MSVQDERPLRAPTSEQPESRNTVTNGVSAAVTTPVARLSDAERLLGDGWQPDADCLDERLSDEEYPSDYMSDNVPQTGDESQTGDVQQPGDVSRFDPDRQAGASAAVVPTASLSSEEGCAPMEPTDEPQEPAGEPLDLEESWRTESPAAAWPRTEEAAAESLQPASSPLLQPVAVPLSGASGGGLPPVVPPGAGKPLPASVPQGPEQNQDDEPEAAMSLLEHLGELRIRLVRALIAGCVGFLLCYSFSQTLYNYLALPLVRVMPADTKLIYLGLPDAFFVDLKVAFVAGCFLTSPYIFYQIWSFIAPGLYAEEKRYIFPLSLCSALFFIAGAAFCYFGVFPVAFKFFLSYSTDNIVAMPSIDSYLSFTLKMLIAFGLIFEMPLFAFFLARMGLVTATLMRKVRKYAVLVIFIVAAILTPPDVFSQMMMAVPMIVLYELSVFVAAAVGRDKKKTSDKDAAKAAA